MLEVAISASANVYYYRKENDIKYVGLTPNIYMLISDMTKNTSTQLLTTISNNNYHRYYI